METWDKLVYLVPPDTTKAEYDLVQEAVFPTRSEIAFSANSAFARPSDVAIHRVIVYDVARWGGRSALENWVAQRYVYTPPTIIEYRDWPSSRLVLRSPVPSIPLYITSRFRAARVYNGVSYEHEGIDLRVIDGGGRIVPVHAAAAGVVEYVALADRGGYGIYIRVRHQVGSEVYKTWYCHLSSVGSNIRAGYGVYAGEYLGVGGNSGNSQGAHLHFNVEWVGHRVAGRFISGDWVDPTPYLFS